MSHHPDIHDCRKIIDDLLSEVIVAKEQAIQNESGFEKLVSRVKVQVESIYSDPPDYHKYASTAVGINDQELGGTAHLAFEAMPQDWRERFDNIAMAMLYLQTGVSLGG